MILGQGASNSFGPNGRTNWWEGDVFQFTPFGVPPTAPPEVIAPEVAQVLPQVQVPFGAFNPIPFENGNGGDGREDYRKWSGSSNSSSSNGPSFNDFVGGRGVGDLANSFVTGNEGGLMGDVGAPGQQLSNFGGVASMFSPAGTFMKVGGELMERSALNDALAKMGAGALSWRDSLGAWLNPFESQQDVANRKAEEHHKRETQKQGLKDLERTSGDYDSSQDYRDRVKNSHKQYSASRRASGSNRGNYGVGFGR